MVGGADANPNPNPNPNPKPNPNLNPNREWLEAQMPCRVRSHWIPCRQAYSRTWLPTTCFSHLPSEEPLDTRHHTRQRLGLRVERHRRLASELHDEIRMVVEIGADAWEVSKQASK